MHRRLLAVVTTGVLSSVLATAMGNPPAQASIEQPPPSPSPVVEIFPKITPVRAGGPDATAIVDLPSSLPLNFRFYTHHTTNEVCFGKNHQSGYDVKVEMTSDAGRQYIKQVAMKWSQSVAPAPQRHSGQGYVQAERTWYFPVEYISVNTWYYYNVSPWVRNISANPGQTMFMLDKTFTDQAGGCTNHVTLQIEK
jgi:hypothetical protein